MVAKDTKKVVANIAYYTVKNTEIGRLIKAKQIIQIENTAHRL